MACPTCSGKEAKTPDAALDPDMAELSKMSQQLGGPDVLHPLGMTGMPGQGFEDSLAQTAMSDNVIDERDLWAPTEDAKLFNNDTGQIVDDPTVDQSMGGYRVDPWTGDVTTIGANGESVSVAHPDGTFSDPTDGIKRKYPQGRTD